MSNNVWSELHDRYKAQGLEDKPNIFADAAMSYFPKQGIILELGAGLGQDGRYFADNGYEVVLTDLEESALKTSLAKTKPTQKIETKALDLLAKLPFGDASFDVVYAHLALHYFHSQKTKEIFAEIRRVLKPGGVLAFLVNSINDPEFNTGKKLEDEFFEVGNKTKRFFSVETAKKFTGGFEILLFDDQGETIKDNAAGTHNLIRFVGRKIAE